MRLLQVILFLLVCGPLLAQGELDTQEKIFWRNERSIGLLLNSDGGGILYRELRQTKPSKRYFIEGGMDLLKDPKEKRTSTYTPSSFVFGKLNSTWTLKAGFGYQQEIFHKRDLGGVSISWYAGAGPAVTFAKPIYYQVITEVVGNTYYYEEQKFDVAIHQLGDIAGKAPFVKGFDEIKLYPGFYTHAGFNFEYSKSDKLTHSLEVGFSFSGFNKKIPIMANDNNKQFFPAFYVSYRIGFILDPLNPGKFFPNLFRHKEE
jgi:hypothetical protein